MFFSCSSFFDMMSSHLLLVGAPSFSSLTCPEDRTFLPLPLERSECCCTPSLQHLRSSCFEDCSKALEDSIRRVHELQVARSFLVFLRCFVRALDFSAIVSLGLCSLHFGIRPQDDVLQSFAELEDGKRHQLLQNHSICALFGAIPAGEDAEGEAARHAPRRGRASALSVLKAIEQALSLLRTKDVCFSLIFMCFVHLLFCFFVCLYVC